MAEFNERLVELLERQSVRIPEPVLYTGSKGSINITDFFVAFERFCVDRYSKDYVSWLQVLPSYIKGEAHAIVQAFGYGAEYPEVKQKLLDEFSHRKSLGSNVLTDFYAATRHVGESLTCYSIRLSALVRKISVAPDSSQELMVRSKILSALSEKIAQQVEVQLGHRDDVTLAELIRLAVILESQAVRSSGKVGVGAADVNPESVEKSFKRERLMESKIKSCRFCDKTGHVEADCYRKHKACFSCGELGHFARECTVNSSTRRDTRNNDRTSGRNTDRHDNRAYKRNDERPSDRNVNDRERNNDQGREFNTQQRARAIDTPLCGFCGKDYHVLADCNIFMQRCLACSWCGECTHPSYQCKTKGLQEN